MGSRMGIEWDPKTRTYSARIVIGAKEPLSPDKMKAAMRRAIMGMSGQLKKRIAQQKARELTDLLFWCEEGWI